MTKKIEVGVIGLGKFGMALAETLLSLGHSVLGVDEDEKSVRRAQGVIPQVYQADARDKAALEQLGFNNFDYVMVSIGRSMEASILVTLNLQELGVPRIWVKAVSEEHRKVLDRVGAHLAIIPEVFVAQQLAHRMAVPGLLEVLPLGKGMLVRETEVDAWAGKTLRDLNLTNRFGVQVVAIRPAGAEDFNFVPKADIPLSTGDVLVLLGHTDNVLKVNQ